MDVTAIIFLSQGVEELIKQINQKREREKDFSETLKAVKYDTLFIY